MNEFSVFIKIIEELIELFDKLIPVEQDKLNAAIKNRVSFVEDCMHKEQAALMQLKGLDQKREAELKKLNMDGYSFKQVLENVPDDVYSALKPLFDRLTEQVQTIQSITDNVKDIIDVNLHVIQSSLAADASGKETYSASGKKQNNKKKSLTNRSI